MKNVLFDLEGTLIDSKALQVRVLEKVFAHFGVDTKNIDMVSLIGPPLIKTFIQYFGANSAQNALDFYMEVFENIEISDIFVNDEIKKALPLLKQCDFRLFTTSLQVVEIVERELKYLDIFQYFDCVVGDDKAKPYTSKTDLVAKLIKAKKLDRAKTCLVGDTEFDRECAMQNGIKFIPVAWGYGFKNNARCVKSTEELLNSIDM